MDLKSPTGLKRPPADCFAFVAWPLGHGFKAMDLKSPMGLKRPPIDCFAFVAWPSDHGFKISHGAKAPAYRLFCICSMAFRPWI